VLALALLSPSSAVAAQRHVSPAFRLAQIRLEGSHGYTVGFSFFNRDATIAVQRRRAKNLLTSLYTSTPTAFTRDRLSARFGRFGRISVRFVQTGPTRRTPNSNLCKGGASVSRKGVFVGTMRFRGEDGYTQVSSSRARGTIESSPKLRCKGIGLGKPETVEEVALSAVRCDGLQFGATLNGFPRSSPPVFPDERAEVGFSASTTELQGKLKILRLANIDGPESTFRFAEDLSTATVAPPPPFHGTATFLRGAEGEGAWTGSLGVSFPGRDVALVGTGFKPTLRRFTYRTTGALVEVRQEPNPCRPSG
jgi:hypothetical protein